MTFSSWREAGAEKMDYLIAVTDNDAVNIMSCLIAHRCGIRRKIARVRSLELWDDDALMTEDDLKIDLVIRPEELAAQEVARLMKMRAGNVVIDIAGGHMALMATRIDEESVLAHTKIKDLSKKNEDFYFRIVSIARGITTIIPSGDREILPNDYVFALAHAEDLDRLMQFAGVSSDRRHRVMIVGGGLIGSRVAELLEGSFPVRLLERDEGRAEELSFHLERTELLHGDGSDSDTLLKAGLLDMNTLIAATGDNETNIMSSVMAKQLVDQKNGHKLRSIALVKREEYLTLAASMGSDIVLNKKVLAGNEILKYIRRGKMLSVAHLHGNDAEVVELVAEEGSPITKKPLYQLEGIRDKIIIGGICRQGDWEIAVGSTQVEPGDIVIGISASRDLRDLQGLILG